MKVLKAGRAARYDGVASEHSRLVAIACGEWLVRMGNVCLNAERNPRTWSLGWEGMHSITYKEKIAAGLWEESRLARRYKTGCASGYFFFFEKSISTTFRAIIGFTRTDSKMNTHVTDADTASLLT